MYTEFFGLREKPFRLTPNPDYLFLGESHKEALAQLVYAAGTGEGFTAIIGEVGTGKTTLCRAFLEGLGGDAVSGYIFDPVTDGRGLLKAICTEYGIQCDEGADIHALVDALNAFLLDPATLKLDVILVIDEAQGLSRDVLEQLRRISNLETSRRKLIQIVLVGQPELEAKLACQDLRQLRQRISQSCRIQPLNLEDTGRYIRHRMETAGWRGASPFSGGAVRRIHRYTGGIPRLINIACDRCLLAAYTNGSRKLDHRIAGSALRDMDRGIGYRPFGRWKPVAGIMAAALLSICIGAAVGLLVH